MINPTLQQVIDQGAAIGLEEKKCEQWYHYYKAQGWKFSSGLEITNIRSALFRWKQNQYRFEKNNKNGKIKLYPIKGKMCSEKGCGMPAVYKWTSDAGYDFYDCADHMPEKVKGKYK